MKKRTRSEAGIGKVALEAIKSARRFLALREKNLLPEGASRLLSRRLRRMEEEIQRGRRRGIPEAKMVRIAREAADVLSETLKALLRYVKSCFVGARTSPEAS